MAVADQKNKVPFAGAEDSHRPWKEKMKQRSFYMDDETYALIEAHATRLGTSNGTALRMLVRHELLDAPAEPVNHYLPESFKQALERADRPEPPLVDGPTPSHPQGETGIVLPPDRQETFKVPERFKEKGPRAPKAVHSDDDF
jgi:hypothetical protein